MLDLLHVFYAAGLREPAGISEMFHLNDTFSAVIPCG